MNYLCPTVSRTVSLFLSQLKSSGSHANLIPLVNRVQFINQPIRTFTVSSIRYEEAEAEVKEEEQINPIILRHPERDRRKKISIETSIRYLKSAAFKEAYGDEPVWFHYRRNHKGRIPPAKTRQLCVRGDVVATGSPCPICRDEYLVVDYQNIDLLKHFISPVTGEILSFQKTNVCQKQHKNLLVAFEKARQLGLITFDVPFRSYNYSEYKPK